MTVCDSLIETLVKLVTSEPTADANVVTLIKCKIYRHVSAMSKRGNNYCGYPIYSEICTCVKVLDVRIETLK